MLLLAIFLAMTQMQPQRIPAWEGPGLLCGAMFSIELKPGELAAPISPGIHQRSAVIRTAGGDLVYEEFESLISQREPAPGRPLASGFVAYRTEDGGRVSYRLLEGRGVRLILSGEALDGSSRDQIVLDRIRARPGDSRLCTYSYRYD